MALKGKAITVCYVAWNVFTGQPATGDAANHTLKLLQDGAEASPTNAPAEADSVNLPGVYKLALTAGDMGFNVVTLGGKSSTANVVIVPLVLITEQGNLDAQVSTRSTYAGGDTAGTTTLVGRLTAGRAANLDNLDAAVSTRSTFAGGAVASVTGAVTVGTNNDKAGYALSPAGLDEISTAAPAGVASNFREMMVQGWRRMFRKVVKSATDHTIKTLADDGVTVLTSQPWTDDGAGNETLGAAS